MAAAARKTVVGKRAAMRALRTLLRNPRKDLPWYHQLGQHVETIHPTDEGRDYGRGVMRELVLELRWTVEQTRAEVHRFLASSAGC